MFIDSIKDFNFDYKAREKYRSKIMNDLCEVSIYEIKLGDHKGIFVEILPSKEKIKNITLHFFNFMLYWCISDYVTKNIEKECIDIVKLIMREIETNWSIEEIFISGLFMSSQLACIIENEMYRSLKKSHKRISTHLILIDPLYLKSFTEKSYFSITSSLEVCVTKISNEFIYICTLLFMCLNKSSTKTLSLCSWTKNADNFSINVDDRINVSDIQEYTFFEESIFSRKYVVRMFFLLCSIAIFLFLARTYETMLYVLWRA